jgi:hypothetical protein
MTRSESRAACDPQTGRMRLVISQPCIANARQATGQELADYFPQERFLRYSGPQLLQTRQRNG